MADAIGIAPEWQMQLKSHHLLVVYFVGTLPDGYVRTNPLPQIPTMQSVPTTRERLPGYLGIPIGIPMLRSPHRTRNS